MKIKKLIAVAIPLALSATSVVSTILVGPLGSHWT